MGDPEVEPGRGFSREPSVRFYRQRGGCVEIWQIDPMTDVQDIVHLCGDDDARAFLKELGTFITDTRSLSTTEGSH